jgi:hypothetical protein
VAHVWSGRASQEGFVDLRKVPQGGAVEGANLLVDAMFTSTPRLTGKSRPSGGKSWWLLMITPTLA